ncbi:MULTISPECIES: hypothetical protein [unclassified Calothrix]|nr:MULTISPECIES: hypothetical protein [unclassified Calothrix]
MPNAQCPMPNTQTHYKIPELLDTMVGIFILVSFHVCCAEK